MSEIQSKKGVEVMYPIMLDINDKQVVVIGGGRIALRKTKGLLHAGARVTIVSPILIEGFEELDIVWQQKEYEAADLSDSFLIFACTDDYIVNRQVKLDSKSSQLVNVTSDKELSDFYNMAVLERDDYLLALSTKGDNPSKAKSLRNELEAWLENDLTNH